MADKLQLGTEVRELKIGQSFTNPRAGAFHTIRYDFKPASVDVNKMATVDVGGNNQVTVTVPHLDGAGVPQTVFKGSQRPYQKECVLIIDRVTGEITLERLSNTIQVKKTRSELTRPLLPQDRGGNSNSDRPTIRPQTPPPPPIGQRQSNKTRVTSGARRPDRLIQNLPDRPIQNMMPKHSPLHASPNQNYSSPVHPKSPKRDREINISNNDRETRPHSQSALASLPMIGMDDFSEPQSVSSVPVNSHNGVFGVVGHLDIEHNGVGEITDTSSSDSSSDSDSDHELPANSKTVPPNRSNGHSNGNLNNKMSIPTTLLNEDLRLSESGSDSD